MPSDVKSKCTRPLKAKNLTMSVELKPILDELESSRFKIAGEIFARGILCWEMMFYRIKKSEQNNHLFGRIAKTENLISFSHSLSLSLTHSLSLSLSLTPSLTLSLSYYSLAHILRSTVVILCTREFFTLPKPSVISHTLAKHTFFSLFLFVYLSHSFSVFPLKVGHGI